MNLTNKIFPIFSTLTVDLSSSEKKINFISKETRIEVKKYERTEFKDIGNLFDRGSSEEVSYGVAAGYDSLVE